MKIDFCEYQKKQQKLLIEFTNKINNNNKINNEIYFIFYK